MTSHIVTKNNIFVLIAYGDGGIVNGYKILRYSNEGLIDKQAEFKVSHRMSKDGKLILSQDEDFLYLVYPSGGSGKAKDYVVHRLNLDLEGKQISIPLSDPSQMASVFATSKSLVVYYWDQKVKQDAAFKKKFKPYKRTAGFMVLDEESIEFKNFQLDLPATSGIETWNFCGNSDEMFYLYGSTYEQLIEQPFGTRQNTPGKIFGVSFSGKIEIQQDVDIHEMKNSSRMCSFFLQDISTYQYCANFHTNSAISSNGATYFTVFKKGNVPVFYNPKTNKLTACGLVFKEDFESDIIFKHWDKTCKSLDEKIISTKGKTDKSIISKFKSIYLVFKSNQMCYDGSYLAAFHLKGQNPALRTNEIVGHQWFQVSSNFELVHYFDFEKEEDAGKSMIMNKCSIPQEVQNFLKNHKSIENVDVITNGVITICASNVFWGYRWSKGLISSFKN